MYCVYIIQNPQGGLYIGQTEQRVEERVARHNRGGEKYTTNKGPWKIIYTEIYNTRTEALAREKYLKKLKNPKYILEKIIKNNF
jgi:putative endonuclease